MKKPVKQHLLVTGGTGFIGKPLCQLLIEQGHHITLLTRDKQKAKPMQHGRLTIITSLAEIAADTPIDSVINLTGEPVAQRWTKASKARILDSRITMLDNLEKWLTTRANKPHSFLQASAIGYYGIFDNHYDEHSDVDCDYSFVQAVCDELEDATAAISAMGIRTCIIRLGLVLEKDGGALQKLIQPYQMGMGGTIDTGKQWWSWIHRDDAVGIFNHLLTHPTCEGVYNGTAPEPVTQKDFATLLGKSLHRPTLLPMPRGIVKLMFSEMGIELMAHGPHISPTRTLASGYNFKHPTLEAAFNNIFPPKKERK